MVARVMDKPVGYLGGTFDPLHRGHLQIAEDAMAVLGLSGVVFVPAHQPPHKSDVSSTPSQRLEMLQAGLADYPAFSIDVREYQRETPSWTVETLRSLRQSVGDSIPIVWLIGGDSLASLTSWKQWRELLQYAHLVAMARPDYPWPGEGELGAWIAQHCGAIADLQKTAAGKVLCLEESLVDISSTGIRQSVIAGEDISDRVTTPVRDYIEKNRLYRQS